MGIRSAGGHDGIEIVKVMSNRSYVVCRKGSEEHVGSHPDRFLVVLQTLTLVWGYLGVKYQVLMSN